MELLPLVCLCLLSCSGDGVKVLVREGSDAVLPCLISTEDLEGKFFDWRKVESQTKKKEVFMYEAGNHYNNGLPGQDEQFKGRVSHFQDQLQNGNASIKITRTKIADSGNYSCDFPKLEPSQTFYIELVVDPILKDRTGENIPGAASEPYVTILKTDDGTVLQCKVLGASPKPKVEWKDSSGNILPVRDLKETERGDSYDIVLQTALTKTDNFRCVVTQEEFSHQIYAEIHAAITGAASKPYVTTVETDEGRMLQCEVLGASPKPKVEWKDSSGKILQAEKPKVTKSGDSYDIVLRAALTKTDNFRCVVTQEGSSSPLSAEIHAVTGSNTRWIITVVVLIILLVLAVAVAVMFYHRSLGKTKCKKVSTPVAANGQPDANEGTKMIASAPV